MVGEGVGEGVRERVDINVVSVGICLFIFYSFSSFCNVLDVHNLSCYVFHVFLYSLSTSKHFGDTRE